MKVFLLSLLITVALQPIVLAQNGGLDLLNVNPSSFALSKSEATTSIPDGANSIYSNPALLVLNGSSSLDLSYTFWVADIQNVFGGINFVNDKRAIAFSFYTSGADNYEQYNRPGQSTGNFSVQYLSLSTAYAYKFRNYSIGLSAQYLREEVFTYLANGYAFNLGLAATLFDERFNVGFSANNLGEMDKLNAEATNVPGVIKFGLSGRIFTFTPPKNESLPVSVLFAADIVKPIDSDERSPGGSEINDSEYLNLSAILSISDTIELSTGYRTGETARSFSFGATVISNNMKFNYALLPFETGFGTAHSMGIQYSF